MSSNRATTTFLALGLLIGAIGLLSYFLLGGAGSNTDQPVGPLPSPPVAGPVKPPRPILPSAPTVSLPAPSQWIDPLDVVGADTSALTHADEPTLATDADEEKTFTQLKTQYGWFDTHPLTDPTYPQHAAALRKEALEAIARWPQSKHISDIRYYALRCGESFPPEATCSDEFWAWAEAKATQQRGAKPQAIAVREVARVQQAAKLAQYGLLYGKKLIEQSPDTPEAYWASFYIGKIYHFTLNNNPAARKAYLYTAESKDAYLRVMGRWWALKQGMQFLTWDTIAVDGPLLLKEETVKKEDRPWISMITARAFYELKRYDEALVLVRAIQKDAPEAREAKEAKTLEDQIIKKVFNDRAQP